MLQQQTCKENFEFTLNSTLTYLVEDKDTENFGNYFRNKYSNNFEQWAYCFRNNCFINTNMHLEAMHKVIKYFYLDRKNVKRLDKGLQVILKFVRDKSLERIIKLIKGKNTHYTREIFKKHNEAMDLNFEIEFLESYWTISKDCVSYTVKKILDTKCCEVICNICNICLHMYSCNCLQYNNNVICEHIHFLIRHINSEVNKCTEEEKITDNFVASVATTSNGPSPNNHKLSNIIMATFSKLQQLDFTT